MKRFAPIAMFLSIAACSSGIKPDGATVIGRVQDEAGTGISEAAVTFDGDPVNVTATGQFTFGAKRGTSLIDVQADGYRRVTAEIKIGGGDNHVTITMVVCTPVIDAGCDEPTPTPTPTPTPHNVLASYVGVNANVPGGFPNGFGNWTGSATLDGLTRNWTLGDSTNNALGGGTDLAFNECWADAGETATYNGGGLDHCSFWWDEEGGGQLGNPDAIFYVRIPGAVYTATVPHTITFADGMTAAYYEGNLASGFSIGSFTKLHDATEGTLILAQNGLLAGDPVSITGQASFLIPTLP